MSLYAINDSTLTAIGDAIRDRTEAQEEVREVSYEVDAVYNHNLAELNLYETKIYNIIPEIDNTPDIDIGEYNYTIEVPNATSIKVKAWLYVNDCSGVTTFCYLNLGSGDSYNNLVNATRLQNGVSLLEQEYDIPNENKFNINISIQVFNPSLPPMINYTAHIEVYGFDSEGNPIEGEKQIVVANDMVKNTMTPEEMVRQINSLPKKPQPVVLSGNGSDSIKSQLVSKYLDLFGDTITTKDIKSGNAMFKGYTGESIPFDINFQTGNNDVYEMFSGCVNLKTVPKLNNLTLYQPSKMFQDCQRLREFPEDYFDSWDMLSYRGNSMNRNYMFYNCYSLRRLPESFLKQCYTTHANAGPGSNYYQGMFQACYVLDEIKELGLCPKINSSSGVFGDMFYRAGRLKSFTFVTNEDGTPKQLECKNQTINFTYTGYLFTSGLSVEITTKLNTGITADKQVKDDATYQALKNDPDWFSADANYSRYNRLSAVETINSLPDTSVYLTANGGSNTIQFKGSAGALTDGGAINTMTEEEIAVATAKGWTVSFV